MFPNRIRISKGASDQLKLIKQRTGLTPNILCRIAIMLSLRRDCLNKKSNAKLDGLEFNLSTLFGEHAALYECLLRQAYGELTQKEAEVLLASHADDGVMVLKAARSLSELTHLR